MNALKNRVQLIGNIGQTPEVREINGTKMARINLVTNDRFRNASGEFVDNATWHKLVAWGKSAEFAEKFLDKGKGIAVDGKLSHRNYINKAGEKRFVTEVIVNEFAFVRG